MSNAPPITPNRQEPAEIMPIDEGPLKTLPSLRRMTAQDLGIFFRHTLGDHGDHLDVRIVQGFHPALHRPICADVDETGVDLGMVLGRFRDGLIDGNGHKPLP